MKHRTVKLAALALALAAAWAAHASAAPWYRWKNVVNHTILCSQNSPGDAWKKFQGPYSDSRCRKEGVPQ
ncbi:MAG: hypothetical protein JO002_18115 [Burkholderiaceae bacterium]|nr:hypothetical protein [Burkholderiaceae bacterium]